MAARKGTSPTKKKAPAKKKAAAKKKKKVKAKAGASAAKKAPVQKAPVEKSPEVAVDPVLQLDSQLSIKSVGELKDLLSAADSAEQPVSIDAGSVESVDTAALQLLVAFARHCEAQSGGINWVKTSDEFVASAQQVDLHKHLGLESV